MLQATLNWIHQHPYLTAAVVTYYVLSNLVMAMPTPQADDKPYYKYLFAALHGIFGNIPRIVMTLFPQFAIILGKLFGANGNQQPNQPPAAASPVDKGSGN